MIFKERLIMDKNIELKDGLYISFQNKNMLNRFCVENNKISKLEPVDYRLEIQNFCDCELSDLEDEINCLTTVTNADETELKNSVNRCYEIADIIKQRNETLGVLLLGVFAQAVSNKDILLNFEGSNSLENALTTVSIRLRELIEIQRKVRNFFPCLIHNELFGDYLKQLVPKSVFCNTVYTCIDNEELKFLFFDYAKDYYNYLMYLFLNRKETVCECELCNRYFVPKTKKKTLYCDRIFKDDKTCKQIGPLLKHKKFEEEDLVLQTFAREKNKMYKRMERTYMFGETPKSITLNEYLAWLDNVSKIKNLYLKNEIESKQAIKFIMSE